MYALLTDFAIAKNFGPMASEVMHKNKNLFCHVATISNLVQEFNGLVSTEGPTQVGPLALYRFNVFTLHFSPIYLLLLT